MIQKEQLEVLKEIFLIVGDDIGGNRLCIIMCGRLKRGHKDDKELTLSSFPQFQPSPPDTAHC